MASASVSGEPAARNPLAAARAKAALTWLARHDPGYAALRRAARTAVVMPSMFAIGDLVIENAYVATFAAFGSFSLLLLVDFQGPMSRRLQAQMTLTLAAAALVCLGTLTSRSTALGAIAMALVGFAVLFSGVLSSVLASASVPLLLSFIISVSLAGPNSSIPDRLAGWGLAGGAGLIAIVLLWPAPQRNPLRVAATEACRAMAGRLRAEIAYVLAGMAASLQTEHDTAVAASDRAIEKLRATFFATPYRPTGLSTAARAVVRLVDEFNWLNAIAVQSAPHAHGTTIGRPVCEVKRAVAEVLECSGEELQSPQRSPDDVNRALEALQASLAALETAASQRLTSTRSEPRQTAQDVVSSLDPGFRAQEMSFVAARIAANAQLAAAADRRSWFGQLLGREPTGIGGSIASAQERAAAHVERHSLTLHNSVRGAAGLGLAVLVAKETGVQHAFWVVFGTLSVLRSNALTTGQNIIRSLLGTAVGFAVGAALVQAIGTNTDVLWALLPVAILLAGLAPAAVSFAAGQAAFTLVLLILFNILAPAGWRIGLVRIEDVAIGCAVSLAVGLSFWPRGAGAALSRALADAYTDAVAYLAAAVRFGLARCETQPCVAPEAEAMRAAAAARRLDDTFRGYLAERGRKPVPLAEMTTLVTGVAALRLAGTAVVSLWSDGDVPTGDRAAAGRELVASTELLTGWYEAFASSLEGAEPVPEPLASDSLAGERLAETVADELHRDEQQSVATAVRVIWTGDHLDAARRLQATLTGNARAALKRGALAPRGHETAAPLAAPATL